MVAKTTDALDREGEEAAQRLIRFFADRYRHALAQLVDPKGYEERKQRAIEEVARTARTEEAKASRTKKARKHPPKVDLMEGFEFPDDEEVVKNVNQSAARFSPLATSFTRPDQSSTQAPVRDRPSMDLFQVTAFAEVESDSIFHTEPVEEMLGEASTSVQRLLFAVGSVAVVAGLVMAIMGARMTMLMSCVGILWMVGGIGLIGGGHRGWMLGTMGYGLSGLAMVGYPLLGTPPAWLLPGWLVLGGIITIGVTGALFHPRLRPKLGRLSPLTDFDLDSD